MSELIQHLIDAASLGALYAVLALGLAIVFSVMGLLNFAYGELITLSAYSMYGLHAAGVPWAGMVAGAILTGIAAALVMERVAFRPVRGSSATTMLLTSFGLAIMIQAVLAAAISPRAKAVPQPEWLTSTIDLGIGSVQAQQLLTIAVSAVALAGLTLFLKSSFTGRAMRAAAIDFDATRLMGIRANRVIASAFAVSGALAGIAAVLLLARRGTVMPTMGLVPVLVALVATVVGGIGNLKGAVAGGFLIGLVETGLRIWLPEGLVGFTDAFLYGLIAVILLARPRGLFGSEEAIRV